MPPVILFNSKGAIMARNKKWYKKTLYGKYRMLKRIEQFPGSTAVFIADRHPRGMANIREHVEVGYAIDKGSVSRGRLYITDKGVEALNWQDITFNDDKQEYDREEA